MKQLLVFLLLLCSATVSAQDVIVKKDGSTVVCRVVELTDTEITYKKWSDLNGSNYVMERSAASAVNYENGKKVNLSESTNLYMPYNQNDGTQQYNDKALMNLDMAIKNPQKKAKTLKKIVLYGGGALVIVGGILMVTTEDENYDQQLMAGGIVLGCGVIGGVTLYLMSRHYQKQADMLQSSVIYNQEFKLKNGSSLMAGIDMLNDRAMGQKALGIGLRYNF